MQLLDGGIHAFLQNSNLLILLFANAVHLKTGIIELFEEIVNLNLLRLVSRRQ